MENYMPQYNLYDGKFSGRGLKLCVSIDALAG
jgi:hypothetical protein